ncbi:hypothetical protein OAG36_00105 [bacterium]|nr:hypothetical protein [bacterium]
MSAPTITDPQNTRSPAQIWRSGNIQGSSDTGSSGTMYSLKELVQHYFEFAPDKMSSIESLGEMSQETTLSGQIKTAIESAIPKLFSFESNYNEFLEYLPAWGNGEFILTYSSPVTAFSGQEVRAYQYKSHAGDYGVNHDDDDWVDDEVVSSFPLVITDVQVDADWLSAQTQGNHYLVLTGSNPDIVRVSGPDNLIPNGDYTPQVALSNIFRIENRYAGNPADITDAMWQEKIFTPVAIGDPDDDNDGILDEDDPNPEDIHYQHIGTAITKETTSYQHVWLDSKTTRRQLLAQTEGGTLLTDGGAMNITGSPTSYIEGLYESLNPDGVGTIQWNANQASPGKLTLVLGASGVPQYVIPTRDDEEPNFYYVNDKLRDTMVALSSAFNNLYTTVDGLTPLLVKGARGLKYGPDVGDPRGTLNDTLDTGAKSDNSLIRSLATLNSNNSTDNTDYSKTVIGSSGPQTLNLIKTQVNAFVSLLDEAIELTDVNDDIVSDLEQFVVNMLTVAP